MEFTRALLNGASQGREFLVGLDQTYPKAALAIRDELGSYLPASRFLAYQYPGPRYAHGDPRDALRPSAEMLVRNAYASRSPDIVHVNSLFEGLVEHAAGLGRLSHLPGTLSSVTLYDLIPLVMQEGYLRDDVARAWYERKVAELSRFDVFLCISESTKNDASTLLGIDEDKLAVIGAGVDPEFMALLEQPCDSVELRASLGIAGRFVLYTGNGDPRKNLEGAIRAFAKVPRHLRKGVQMVFNQVGDESKVRKLAAKEGLSHGDLVITGWVDDARLAGLLRETELFFFPSLYEGFGLPVLEALAAGAAVVCGDNSSLPEVIGRKDAMFDAESVEDSARILSQALSSTEFRQSLKADAIERAARFTWKKTAAAAAEAWDEALERRALRTVVPVGTGARLKIAMVTPVPGERTGIADYMGGLLPALARRIDVDVFTTAAPGVVSKELEDAFSIRHWSELEARAGDYDQIVYQMGNSPFHSHMPGLLDRLGGMVVLHDFFLSSMFAHMDRCEGMPGIFAKELERSHGRGAITGLDSEEGWGQARVDFPASKRLIENADGIVLHSDHAVELCESYYPGVTRPPIYRIAQARNPQPPVEAATREEIRQRLGVRPDEVLIASFGFLADTKLNLEILEALSIPGVDGGSPVKIAFVGELDGGPYGARVRDALARHPLRSNITITGFVDAADYDDYLVAADIAVQLRANSRGESSRTALDCLANGLPVVVNDYAAFKELPAGVVAKVAAGFSAAELAEVLRTLIESPEERCRLARDGREYIALVHHSDVVAGRFEAAIRNSIENAKERRGMSLADGLTEAAIVHGEDPISLDALGFALHRQKSHERKSLFVDLSEVVRQDYGTGIHRVVRNLTRELVLHEGSGSRCQGVALDESGAYVSAEAFQVERLSVPRSSFSFPFAPAAGDTLFLLDSAWERPERFLPHIESTKLSGGSVGAMVYDLIPLLHPQYCVEYMPAIYEAWLRFVVANCDFIVCITRAVAVELREWLRVSGAAASPRLKIGHVRLGCDLDVVESPARPSAVVEQAIGDGGQATLMVGTLEPRKRHDLALAAFEKLWDEGGTQRLVIIGKEGWNVGPLAERIRKHSELDRKLYWLSNANDADLHHAYMHAGRVLLASDAEGFGLPIVEASRHGRSLLLSDIPVFREVAGRHATYFAAGDLTDLASKLRECPGPASGIPMVTWSQCAEQLLRVIDCGPWDFVLE